MNRPNLSWRNHSRRFSLAAGLSGSVVSTGSVAITGAGAAATGVAVGPGVEQPASRVKATADRRTDGVFIRGRRATTPAGLSAGNLPAAYTVKSTPPVSPAPGRV